MMAIDIDLRRDTMRGRLLMLGIAAVLAAVALGVVGRPHAAGAAIDPANFDAPVANPYFPLEPGTVSIYRGTEDGARLVEHLIVTDRSEPILGVDTVVVRDVLYEEGRLREKTIDWYANDDDGPTWYFGEATATYDRHGNVESTEGSWRAGVDGAVPGIIMPANPRPTDAYRQEFLRGHAEDQAWIVANHETARTPAGIFRDVVRSYEWTRLEPGVVSLKRYAPGYGIVVERDVAGGTEHLVLVEVRHR